MSVSQVQQSLSQLPNSPSVWMSWRASQDRERKLSDASSNPPEKASSDLPALPELKPRKSTSALRQEPAQRGTAFFIEFTTPTELRNPYRGLERPSHAFEDVLQPGTSGHKAKAAELHTMLRKGVLVTSDTGCIIPHPQYCTHGGNHKNGAYQRCCRFFYGIAPDAGTSAGRLTNSFGWDETLEASHLCHRRECMNPAHIVFEPTWQNRKRNYCGFHGECDCGNTPKCLRRYTYAATDIQDTKLCSDEIEVENVLASLRPEFDWRFMNKSDLEKRDAKAATRRQKTKAKKAKLPPKVNVRDSDIQKEKHAAKRKAVGVAQAYKAAKKQATKVAKKVALKAAEKAGLEDPESVMEVAGVAEAAYVKHLGTVDDDSE